MGMIMPGKLLSRLNTAALQATPQSAGNKMVRLHPMNGPLIEAGLELSHRSRSEDAGSRVWRAL
jgi:hypothetical protein